MTDYLKDAAVRLASGMLLEVPFNSIYSYADNLFDVPEMKHGDKKLDKQIKFLKSTTLEQVEYDNLDGQALFTIKNKDDSSFIELSNRGSSRNEIRGEVLRKIIENENKNNPSQTLYSILSKAVKSPEYSDSIVMMRGSLVGQTAHMTLDGAMTNEHFDLFTTMILASVNEKIEKGVISNEVNPKDIRYDITIRTNILKGFNVEKTYELSKTLIENNDLHNLSYLLLNNPKFLQSNQQLLPSFITLNNKISELHLKSDSLREGGYLVEANQVDTLVKSLNTNQEKFIEGKITKVDFIKNSRQLVIGAKQTKLADLRGFGKIFFGILNALTSIATFGIANLVTGRFSIFHKQTNTINKVEALDKAIDDINTFDNEAEQFNPPVQVR